MSWATFYRPEFLWGFLFLGGVLAIHLLKRPRARVLEFSTLRFFRDGAVRASRMRRLRSLLLLLARLLAAAAVVALFAQPYDKRDRLSLLREPNAAIFTWVDPTMSMGYTTGGVSIVEHAGSLIDSLKATLPATVRHLYYDEARGEFVLCDYAKRMPFPKVRYGPAKLAAVLRAWNDARGGYSMPVLLLFSDFQKPTTTLLDALLKQTAPKAPMVCVNLAPRDPWNYSLRNVVFHDAENMSRISVAVGAQGRRLDSGEVSVTLSTIRAGHMRLSVRADDSGEAALTVASALKSFGGNVTLAAAGDPLPFDNTVYFATQARKALRVIIVGDKEKNFPIAAAFCAAGRNRWDPVTAKVPEEVTFDDLDSAGVIVVSGPGSQSRQLEAFLSSRSSIDKVIVFAPNTDDEGFGESATFLARLCRLKKPLTLAVRPAPATIVLPDTISETWRGFPALAAREAAVYRYVEGLPGNVLLRLDNGAPLLTRFADADGRVWVLSATPLGVTGANNLCETGFYVPAIDRVVRYAASSISPAADVWIAGVEHRNQLYSRGKTATVLNSEGAVIDRWQSQPDVVFNQPGIYKIIPDGEASYTVTVIADPEESVLDYRAPSVPESSKGMVMVLSGQQLKEASSGRGRHMSDSMWLLLAIVLLAEVLLWPQGHRFKPHR